jgi:hypothetical protein
MRPDETGCEVLRGALSDAPRRDTLMTQEL